MHKPIKVGFIGFGNMAKAIAQALEGNKHYQLLASSPLLKPGMINNMITDSDNRVIAKQSDVIILAVKPHHMATVLNDIKPVLHPHHLIISVAASKTLHWLEEQLGNAQSIVRCMPNIAIAYHKGATAMIANAYVSDEQKRLTADLFEQGGLITWVNKESDIAIFTALSGSGLAYVFYFIEAMRDAATQLGLDKNMAAQFTLQTFLGALSVLENSDLTPEALRLQVTSKGGTTAAAFAVLEAANIKKTIYGAMEAAYLKGRLGLGPTK